MAYFFEREKCMFVRLGSVILIFCILCVSGCASTLEDVNKDAEAAGKTTGQVLRVPLSASEGVAEGVAGEPESNPYNR